MTRRHFGGRAITNIKSVAIHFKQYAMVAAGGLGLTGGRAPSGPLAAHIGISDPCNHRCVFCWDHPPEERESRDTANRFGGGRPGIMPLEQFKGIVDDLYAMGTRRIDLIGRGEPLSNRNVLEMVRYAKAHEMQLLMTTNGSKLTKPIAEGMIQAGMDRMHISLNAGTPETYPHIHVTETPANYIKVKQNLRMLADLKIAADVEAPYLSLSFVITSKNYFEIADMVDVTNEVGAQDAQFVHTVVHEKTPDLALNEAQYKELHALLPIALKKAQALGVITNLERFAASTPAYMPTEMQGPAVVPCYVGWYYTEILGNGTVLPCPQTTGPVGQLSRDRRLSDVWASPEYTEFRSAAKALPVKNERLSTCECDNCQLRPRNLAIHNFLHPLNQIEAGGEVQRFKPTDFIRKMRGRHGEPVG